jgi:Zn-dependent protease
MAWSFTILRVAGTEVRIHLTFFLLLAWIAVSHYGMGGAPAAIEGTILILSVFLCVLLHEFGHVTAARRYGIKTPDITLLPIGGVARLERMPENPREELVVAIAGPLVNVVIAGLIWIFHRGSTDISVMERFNEPGHNLFAKLFFINIFMIVFNLIPAFPMDGGRILRAFLAMAMPYAKATRIAANVGQAFAFLLGFLGLFWNPILIFIAFFVYLGAGQEAAHVQMRETARGLRVSAGMVTEFVSLRPYSTLDEAIEVLLRTSQTDFPVIDNEGGFIGLLTRQGLVATLKEKGSDAVVESAMIQGLPVIHPDEPFEDGIQRLQASESPALPVVDDNARLVGLLTPENIGEMIMLRGALPPGQFPGWLYRGSRR